MQRISLLMVLAIGLFLAGTPLMAQEAAAPEAPATAPADGVPATPEAPPETTPDPPAPEEPVAEEPAAPEPEAPAEPTPPSAEATTEEAPAVEEADPTEAVAEEESGEAVSDELAEEPVAETTDWSGLMERAPAFIALTHHAAVHLPIALWLLGAFFVLVGLVAPSWRNQVPMACLLGGTATSIVAAASGWWYAAYEWGEEWAWGDGFSLEEHLDKHRWTGVMLVIASLMLSILALISQAKEGKAKKLAIFWRLGLLALAAAVAWEGHIGGEMIHGEGFLEEAFDVWINGEE
ncbi:hypothetical protein MalM25_06990 [Planctomycetes bacterium MalM25]|nr:hypothetical protein MalM25_06990 [Planctomycetes bacterium MalM25]